MSTLKVTTYTASQWSAGPTTPAAKLFHAYVENVDTAAYNRQPQSKFYSNTVTFHNTNGATYNSADEMTAWMRELFAPFEKMNHTYDRLREIDNGDGTYALDIWATRHIWVKAKEREGEGPDVSVPLMYSCVVVPESGFSGTEQERLRIKEVWLYWDTGVLRDLVPADAVVFRRVNTL